MLRKGDVGDIAPKGKLLRNAMCKELGIRLARLKHVNRTSAGSGSKIGNERAERSIQLR